MPDEVVRLAAPAPGETVVDGTFGAGGHARLLAPHLAPGGTYVGVDRDATAEPRFEAFAREVAPLATRFVRAPFPDAFAQLAEDGVSADAVILDVGVSSMQLDEVERGFSYAHDAPLDMRMDQSAGEPASELLARLDEGELARTFRELGEERHAGRIARAIVRTRDADPFTRSGQLVDVILAALPPAVRFAPGGHPARRVFQALRIAVNDELGMLDRGLDAALELLVPGGRLVVMSFHSLEDRIVKRRFEAWLGHCTCPPGLPVCVCGAVTVAEPVVRGLSRPTEAEVATNPRAASTRLRAVRRVEPPRPVNGGVR
ncbi:MAG: S-adenosyl-methyltransferase MraW [Thermoleophilia bacterium]|nr:S-adenosyl-methyltransferase MraW [Thermoleophilia bacterium]